ncbi:MAG: GNAT family N-acetyltransferase [Candidatus Dormibacteraeota bacterium]|nr:GNAT family N-acetyltransferase [Candidatus Dormibacteraeota bacterium]
MPSHWPLFDLVVRTPRLELRLPRDDELEELARVAAGGVHDPGLMPFDIPWTDARSPELERAALQWWWSQRAAWTREAWTFTGGVFVDGVVVGVQDLGAHSFPALRSVFTGSWLGRAHQGRGLGREMRAAALHLAFAGLGAREARSGAWHDNLASQGVSRALGYVENGTELRLRRGVPEQQLRFLLSRDAWSAHRRDDIELLGLESCLELFGAGASA